jgi:hypothetical protein
MAVEMSSVVLGIEDPEDESYMFLRDFGSHLQNYTASPRRPQLNLH